MNAALYRRAMEYTLPFGLPVISHAEDDNLSEGASMNEGVVSTELGLPGAPAAAEDVMVARDILLAELTGAHVHIAHLSTAGAVRLVREAKARGVRVTAEVTPHHLVLTDEAVRGFDPNTKMNPPLRTKRDADAVLEALADGTIDCIATDHAPHAASEKEGEFDRRAVGNRRAGDGGSGPARSAGPSWRAVPRDTGVALHRRSRAAARPRAGAPCARARPAM